MIRGLFEDIWWKLLSILLAVAAWILFVGESELSTTVSGPLLYRNAPRDLEISSEFADRLYIKVQGPSTRLRLANFSETAVILDLSHVHRTGQQTFTIGPENVSLPGGVTLVRVIPSQVRVRFEKRLTREVPVEARLGPAPQGYRVAEVRTVPEKLGIGGPESQVEQVQSVQTDQVDLSSTFGDAEFRVPAFVNNPQVRLDGPHTVTVRLKLEKMPAATK